MLALGMNLEGNSGQWVMRSLEFLGKFPSLLKSLLPFLSESQALLSELSLVEGQNAWSCCSHFVTMMGKPETEAKHMFQNGKIVSL